MKYFKVFSIAYLVIAVLSIIEVIRLWNVNRNKAYIFMFLAGGSIFLYFFKRYYYKKFQQHNKSK